MIPQEDQYLTFLINPYAKDCVLYLTVRENSLTSLAHIDCMIDSKSPVAKDFTLNQIDPEHKELLSDFYAKPFYVGIKSEYSFLTSNHAKA